MLAMSLETVNLMTVNLASTPVRWLAPCKGAGPEFHAQCRSSSRALAG